jgi:hypothetical protein
MSISLCVQSVDDPILEELLRHVASIKMPLYQKRDLLRRAEKWLELSDKSAYPRPMVKHVSCEILGGSTSESPRNENIHAQSFEENRSASPQVEGQP